MWTACGQERRGVVLSYGGGRWVVNEIGTSALRKYKDKLLIVVLKSEEIMYSEDWKARITRSKSLFFDVDVTKCTIFLMSLKALSVALNLTIASVYLSSGILHGSHDNTDGDTHWEKDATDATINAAPNLVLLGEDDPFNPQAVLTIDRPQQFEDLQTLFNTRVGESSDMGSKLESTQVESINGKKYILVVVDDYSRYTWADFLRSKDETPEVLINFIRMIQRGLQAQVRIVCTDRGTEFLNKNLQAYFKEEGINHQTKIARTPKHNGDVERQNRTLVEAA
ncbi:putative ribonuclease H-like domain-containing protein [Tanacetum coccineum]